MSNTFFALFAKIYLPVGRRGVFLRERFPKCHQKLPTTVCVFVVLESLQAG